MILRASGKMGIWYSVNLNDRITYPLNKTSLNRFKPVNITNMRFLIRSKAIYLINKIISVLVKIIRDMSRCKKKWTFSVQEDLIQNQTIINLSFLSTKKVSIFVDKMKNLKR